MDARSRDQPAVIRAGRAPRVTGIAGVAIIVAGFVIAVVNQSLSTPSAFVAATLQPFIFLGVAALLFHIGQHVHALHENVIRMAAMQADGADAAER